MILSELIVEYYIDGEWDVSKRRNMIYALQNHAYIKQLYQKLMKWHLQTSVGQCVLLIDSGGNKRSYIVKQTCSKKLQVCLSNLYDLLLLYIIRSGKKNCHINLHLKTAGLFKQHIWSFVTARDKIVTFNFTLLPGGNKHIYKVI